MAKTIRYQCVLIPAAKVGDPHVGYVKRVVDTVMRADTGFKLERYPSGLVHLTRRESPLGAALFMAFDDLDEAVNFVAVTDALERSNRGLT